MTLTVPTMAIATIETDIQKAIAPPGSVGRYRVFFRVPPVLSAGRHPMVLTIAGFNSNAVILPLAGIGLPTISSIVSSGNFGFVGLASPGSILSLFGLNFGVDEDLSLFPHDVYGLADLGSQEAGTTACLVPLLPGRWLDQRQPGNRSEETEVRVVPDDAVQPRGNS